MAPNWIIHSHINTPSLMTTEDLKDVPDSQIEEYFSSVLTVFSARVHDLPEEIQAQITSADQLCGALTDGLLLGFMDTGWVDEYKNAANEISESMGGYPRVCLSQRRELSQAATPQAPVEDGLETPGISRSKDSESEPVFTSPAHSRFSFFDLPKEFRARLYDLLYFRGELHIGDWSFDVKPTGFSRRTEYDGYDRNEGRQRRTSYTVRDLSNTEPLYFNLMLGNKQVASEIAEVFYVKNTFRFLGSAESTLAFLHDRLSRLEFIRRVSMRFSTSTRQEFTGCYNITGRIPRSPLTFHGSWRRIFNVFVHESVGLEDFELILDTNFFHNVPTWTDGAEAVFDTPHLCERQNSNGHAFPGEERNFLQHVARLGGVNIRVTIEALKRGDAEKDAEKESFRRSLEWLIQKKAFGRSYLTDDETPMCRCNRKYLKESCIWDRFGTTRRR